MTEVDPAAQWMAYYDANGTSRAGLKSNVDPGGGGSGDISEAVIIDPATSTRNVIQSSADATELTLKAFAGQTAPTLVAKDESDATTLAVSPTGNVDITATSNAGGQGPIVDITAVGGYPESFMRLNNPDFGAPLFEVEETGRASFNIGAVELAAPDATIWSVNFGPSIPLELMRLFAPTSEGGTKGILWEIDSFDAGDITFLLAARGDQTADVWQIQGPNGVGYGRVVGFRPNGQIISNAHAAPADGDLNNSDFALWLDDTPGATFNESKSKSSDGTVVNQRASFNVIPHLNPGTATVADVVNALITAGLMAP